MNFFELYAKLGLDSSEFDEGVDKSRDKAEGFGSKLKSGLSTAGKVAGVAITAASAAVVKFAKDSLETGQAFDSSMSQIAATLGLTTEEIENNVNGAGDTFQALRDKAQEMGSATNFTAQQAAEGLNILAMSGFSATESIGMIEDVLHLSAAGSMDLATAAGYVSGAMKGFADDTKDAGYYADLMAKGATLANTSVAQLGDAMSSGAAGAAAYGQSADSMTVALLRLAEQGEVGAAAGTALSAAMKDLFTPSDQAAKALKELGVAAYDSEGNARDFNTVVNELQDSLSGMTAEEANAYKQTIFGIQGLNAYNKMTVTGIDKQNEWADALAHASDGMGEAAKQYDTMTDNLQGDLDILSSSFDGLKMAVSDTLMDSAREFVQFGSSALSAITEGFKEGGIDGAMEALGEQLSTGLSMIVEKLPDLVSAATKLLSAFGQALVDNLPVLLDSASEIIQMLVDSLGNEESIQNLVDSAYTIVEQLGQFLIDNAPLLLTAAIQLIMALNEALWDPENLSTLVDTAIELITVLTDALIENLPILIERAPEIIFGIVDAIVENLPKIAEAAFKIMTKLVEAIVENFPKVVEKGKMIVLKVAEGITELRDKMREKANDLIEKIKDGIKEKFEDLKSKGKEIVEKVKEGLTQVIENAKQWGRDLISNFLSGMSEKWENLKSGVSGIAQGIKNFIAFSEPKEGPLSDFHTYAPDMMELYAKGIRDNKYKVLNELADFATEISGGVSGSRLGVSGGYDQPINITVKSILDGKVISETVTKWQRNKSLATGGI